MTLEAFTLGEVRFLLNASPDTTDPAHQQRIGDIYAFAKQRAGRHGVIAHGGAAPTPAPKKKKS